MLGTLRWRASYSNDVDHLFLHVQDECYLPPTLVAVAYDSC